jgi:transposase
VSYSQNSDSRLRCKIAASNRRQMNRQRKQYSADLKAKIAVEAVKGQRTIQEIASHYSVHPNQVTQWKKQLLDGASEVFSSGREHAGEADEQMKAEIYQQVGKLQVELDWLKKSPGCPVSGAARMDRPGRPTTERRAAMRAGRILSFRVLLPGRRRERSEFDADAPARRAVHANAVLWRDQDDRLAGQKRSCGQREARTTTAAADGTGSHLREAEAVRSRAGTSDLSIPAAGFSDREAERVLGDRHHVHPIEARFRVPGCGYGLVQPLRAVLGSIDQYGNQFLSDGIGLGFEEGQAGNLQLRSRSAVHQSGIHRPFIGARNRDQHGRQRPVVGQRFYRTAVANGQVRRSFLERLHGRRRSDCRPREVFSVLQSDAFPSGVGLSDARRSLFFARAKGLWKMTRLRKSAGNGLPQSFAKPCWVSHIYTQARRRRSLKTEHFSTAAIHLRKSDFLSEGWGVPPRLGLRVMRTATKANRALAEPPQEVVHVATLGEVPKSFQSATVKNDNA